MTFFWGARHFNDLRRGVPLMSQTLLSKRLQTLEDAGIIVRRPGSKGHAWEYHPTPACEELLPIIVAIGHWGQRWVRSALAREELGPAMLMWFMHWHFVNEKLSRQRIVLSIEITDVKRMKRWWFVMENQRVDVCMEDPGYEVDITLITDLLTLTNIYVGNLSIDSAQAQGKLRLYGPTALTRTMSSWFARSPFAEDNSHAPLAALPAAPGSRPAMYEHG